MSTCGLAAGLTAAVLLACLPARGDETWSIRNAHFDLRGEGCTITHMAFDAAGQGRYSANLVKRVAFQGLAAPNEAKTDVQKSCVVISGCRATEPLSVANEQANRPDMLLPGHTLGQSFRCEGGAFTEVSVRLPTWAETDSSATLTLRRGGPQGEVVATRRAEDVPDNSWQALTFDPQPAGEYLVEISDPRGTIGWWTHTDDRLAQGQAYSDGVALSQGDRTLRVTGERMLGEATFAAQLDGNRLSLTVALKPESGSPRAFPLQWVLPWKRDGYDVSRDSVPFSRFFTDRQRYMPIEQLKRSDIGMHLTLDGDQWLEAEGAGDYDLRLEANGLWFDADTEPEDLTLRFRTREYRAPDGFDQTGFVLNVLPRRDSVPQDWPAFETPDPALTQNLNRFLYERAFTYPGAPGPAPWLEWTALMRFWHGGPALEGAAAQLPGIVIDDEGYVYTWGGERGWPFPDPKTYDTRHFDTNARFILACWRYGCWTHDTVFLQSQAERLRRAMNYQLTTLKGQEGLIVAASKDVTGKHRGVGNNYWDILPFGHLDAYANAVYYASLEAMAQTEELLDVAGGLQTPSPRRSPAEYRRLAERTKDAYNRTFWDDERGRYIGCIDTDGNRHDYGFTFVNLEAMAYGLASEEQARRIYHWMETEPTSTGKPDTYSAYVFAPRANTLHNPMWDPQTGASKEPGPTEPWWHFGWLGTPYGSVQCQDGGAILYTSFFDLMARTKLLGADNAWQRWTEILARHREPDRLCGGGPLFRGEGPQRVNPGAVGVDIPFPESGLVPTWFVHGVAGLNPTVTGLKINPKLPRALPWLIVRNVQYRGLTLDVRVTKTSARLTSTTPGHRFTCQQTFPQGEGCRFVEPPTGGFPEKPTRPEWIWAPPAAQDHETVYLRRTFDLPVKPSGADVVIAVDNSYTLYVNGVEVGKGEGWAAAQRWDLTTFLRTGLNVIAVEAHNAGGPAGVLARLAAKVDGKAVRTDSNASWRASRQAPPGWTETGFDDSAWEPVVSFGAPPVGPWGAVKLE
ncbi:MAG: hypothetical protein FJX75_15475 [Armatimonadetes bacterium]|nr:hypothetical protein [Armatimonadota bacterium]